jgi:Holliday junction DNA helicase RuvA
MLGKLIGKIDEIYQEHLIINVQNVGYLVFASAKTLAKLTKNQEISLIIQTLVREDAINLFGFLDEGEKIWFNNLCKVKGVGAKVALKILSQIEANEIVLAISSANKSIFAKVSGVGPKMAMRLVTELKDTIKNMPILSSQTDQNNNNFASSKLVNEAINALENLGYRRNEVYQIVSGQFAENQNHSLESLITNSLRKIAK